MDSYVNKLNIWIRGGAFLLMAILLLTFRYYTNISNYAHPKEIHFFVEEQLENLAKKAVFAFKDSVGKDVEVLIYSVPQKEAISLFSKNPDGLILLTRKIPPLELLKLTNEIFPIKQNLWATGSYGSPIKETYIIHSRKESKGSNQFEKFLLSEKSNKIIWDEGLLPARLIFHSSDHFQN